MTSRRIHASEMFIMLQAAVPESAISHYETWLTEAREYVGDDSTVELVAEEIERFRAADDQHSRRESAQRIRYLQSIVARKARSLAYSNSQADKGRAGAAARWQDPTRDVVAGIIKRLAAGKDELGDYLPPRELWGALYSGLDASGLEPEEDGDTYQYAGGSINYQAFRVQVNRIRNR